MNDVQNHLAIKLKLILASLLLTLSGSFSLGLPAQRLPASQALVNCRSLFSSDIAAFRRLPKEIILPKTSSDLEADVALARTKYAEDFPVDKLLQLTRKIQEGHV